MDDSFLNPFPSQRRFLGSGTTLQNTRVTNSQLSPYFQGLAMDKESNDNCVNYRDNGNKHVTPFFPFGAGRYVLSMRSSIKYRKYLICCRPQLQLRHLSVILSCYFEWSGEKYGRSIQAGSVILSCPDNFQYNGSAC